MYNQPPPCTVSPITNTALGGLRGLAAATSVLGLIDEVASSAAASGPSKGKEEASTAARVSAHPRSLLTMALRVLWTQSRQGSGWGWGWNPDRGTDGSATYRKPSSSKLELARPTSPDFPQSVEEQPLTRLWVTCHLVGLRLMVHFPRQGTKSNHLLFP